ncbi:YdeI/OmpD-associated family protein [Carnobacterium gallinarum]|uniref:YdeI/OmpD-associated family protein n=1 Tax=Carnobacterium gallinarum TaxID=2749 RepID=UPI000556D4B9|nr:YdeI/OmpD-associated family protein [Carnobacterium gallinarum]
MEKTIVEKLKLQSYSKKTILNKPIDQSYLTELSDADNALNEKNYDLIFVFVYDFSGMQQIVQQISQGNYLKEKGYLFIAYPKKGNTRYPTFVHRDEIMPGLQVDEGGYLPDSPLKFSRMVSMDDTFTVVGIKEAGKEKMKKSTASSQRVADSGELVVKIQEDLYKNPTELSFYNQLTAGYQRDWARYVYSAKQAITQEKRKKEMIMILENGFKTREFYRQSLR